MHMSTPAAPRRHRRKVARVADLVTKPAGLDPEQQLA
jgi:hypothetical protein